MSEYAPTRFAQEVTSRLRGLIAQYDINQADLALLCDVSQSQFSKMVRGVRPMSIDQLAVVLSALGQDVGDFVQSVDSFLSDFIEEPSPIAYVEEGVRVPEPNISGEQWLDPWGRSALKRLQARSGNVGASSDTEDLHSEDFDVSHETIAKKDVRLAAKRGQKRADVPHAE